MLLSSGFYHMKPEAGQLDIWNKVYASDTFWSHMESPYNNIQDLETFYRFFISLVGNCRYKMVYISSVIQLCIHHKMFSPWTGTFYHHLVSARTRATRCFLISSTFPCRTWWGAPGQGSQVAGNKKNIVNHYSPKHHKWCIAKFS